MQMAIRTRNNLEPKDRGTLTLITQPQSLTVSLWLYTDTLDASGLLIGPVWLFSLYWLIIIPDYLCLSVPLIINVKKQKKNIISVVDFMALHQRSQNRTCTVYRVLLLIQHDEVSVSNISSPPIVILMLQRLHKMGSTDGSTESSADSVQMELNSA